ncbi:zinc C3HC4 type RING finger domain-containing protein [Babesia ovis]|uniref:E3 ubiquitin protein ligase n=1 Tax=Babesia ovis TaxID=5869 RepID=A0A9W5TCX2_BABOV|nr:zinc C3HC4 type RING finger domain-containing protein [Babesia ovis]
MSKKRESTGSAEVLVDLPLQDEAGDAENFFKLRECLEGYRSEIRQLESRHKELLRENDCLRHLCASVGNLFDVLNHELNDTLTEPAVEATNSPSAAAEEFLDLLYKTRLPFSVSRHEDSSSDSDTYTITSDSTAPPDSCKSSTSNHCPADSYATDDPSSYLSTQLEAFNRKKNYLLQRLQQSCTTVVAQSDQREEGSAVGTQQLSVERYKRQVLELAVGRLYDSVSEFREQLRIHRTQCGSHEVEISRLLKLNADLRHSLSDAHAEISNLTASLSKDNASADSETPVSGRSIEEHINHVETVASVEDVTVDMIVGSSLYSRLYDLCQSQDSEISRLERHNASLRRRAEDIALNYDKRLFEHIQLIESTQHELIQRIEDYDHHLDTCQQELIYQRDLNEKLTTMTEQLREERDSLATELETKDRNLCERLIKMSEVIKQFSSCNATKSSLPSSEVSQDQLQNLSVELEEISAAYEERIKQNERLQQQLKELLHFRDKCASLEVEVRAMEDKVSRAMTFCDRKVATSYQFKEELLHRLDTYKKSWLSTYRRGLVYEKKRDLAASALCESQAKLRRCQRDLKESQMRLMQMAASGSHSGSLVAPSEQGDAPTGELESVMLENDVLRRRMTCTVCSEHFRDRCLTKCGHVFCEACIESSIKSRNRKCPVCKLVFDRNDVRRIYLE